MSGVAGTEFVLLRCIGRYVGEVVTDSAGDPRWLRVPCSASRCQKIGNHSHLFDLRTGVYTSPDEAELPSHRGVLQKPPTGGKG